jgi:hypothetical protein
MKPRCWSCRSTGPLEVVASSKDGYDYVKCGCGHVQRRSPLPTVMLVYKFKNMKLRVEVRQDGRILNMSAYARHFVDKQAGVLDAWLKSTKGGYTVETENDGA